MAGVCKCAKCASRIAAIYLSCEETRKVANSKELSVGICCWRSERAITVSEHIEESNAGGHLAQTQLQEGHPEHSAQDRVQVAFEARRGLQSLPDLHRFLEE